jgi:hypothetical protein
MADERGFRFHIDFDPEQQRFVARAFELDAEGHGDTRAEAVEALEQRVEATVESVAVSGSALPSRSDLPDGAGVTLRLPGLLARDLHTLAQRAGTSPEDLAGQLLGRAIGLALGQPDGPLSIPPAVPEEGNEGPTARGPRGGGPKEGGRKRRRRQEGYRPDMEDQANFLAYVRDMEKGGGGGRRR